MKFHRTDLTGAEVDRLWEASGRLFWARVKAEGLGVLPRNPNGCDYWETERRLAQQKVSK